MKRIAAIVIVSSLSAFFGTAMASPSGGNQPSVLTTLLNLLLGNDPTTPVAAGQPGQSCQAQPAGSTPGNTANSPGSPFGGGVSDSKYAGSQPQNSNNPASVSQYDVACFNQATKH